MAEYNIGTINLVFTAKGVQTLMKQKDKLKSNIDKLTGSVEKTQKRMSLWQKVMNRLVFAINPIWLALRTLRATVGNGDIP